MYMCVCVYIHILAIFSLSLSFMRVISIDSSVFLLYCVDSIGQYMPMKNATDDLIVLGFS